MKLHVTVHIFTHKHMQPDCTELSAEPGGWGKKRYVTGGLSDVWSLKNGSNLRDLCSILVTLLHTHTHWRTPSHMHVLTGADEMVSRWKALVFWLLSWQRKWWKQMVGLSFAYIWTSFTYLTCIFIQCNGERAREREAHEHIPSSLFSLFGAFPLFFYPAAHKFISQVTIKGASFFISELHSHDSRIIAVML